MKKYFKYVIAMIVVMLLVDAVFWCAGIISLNKESEVAAVFARTFIALAIALAVMTVIVAIFVPISLKKAQKANEINYTEKHASQLKALNSQIEITALQIVDLQKQLGEDALPRPNEYTSIVEANNELQRLNSLQQELQIKLSKKNENKQ